MSRRPFHFRSLAVAATGDSATAAADMSYRPYVSATIQTYAHKNDHLQKQSTTHEEPQVSPHISPFSYLLIEASEVQYKCFLSSSSFTISSFQF